MFCFCVRQPNQIKFVTLMFFLCCLIQPTTPSTFGKIFCYSSKFLKALSFLNFPMVSTYLYSSLLLSFLSKSSLLVSNLLNNLLTLPVKGPNLCLLLMYILISSLVYDQLCMFFLLAEENWLQQTLIGKVYISLCTMSI